MRDMITILLVGFEPTISAGERPQTYALDRADTGTGWGVWGTWLMTETVLQKLILGSLAARCTDDYMTMWCKVWHD